MEFECKVLFAVWMWLNLRRNSTRHVESKGMHPILKARFALTCRCLSPPPEIHLLVLVNFWKSSGCCISPSRVKHTNYIDELNSCERGFLVPKGWIEVLMLWRTAANITFEAVSSQSWFILVARPLAECGGFNAVGKITWDDRCRCPMFSEITWAIALRFCTRLTMPCVTLEHNEVVIVHEHRGEPDGMVICHLPFGPTAYFGNELSKGIDLQGSVMFTVLDTPMHHWHLEAAYEAGVWECTEWMIMNAWSNCRCKLLWLLWCGSVFACLQLQWRGLSNVVLRHDLAEKPPPMSEVPHKDMLLRAMVKNMHEISWKIFCEANPHLVFHGFTAKTGLRLKTILQAGQKLGIFGALQDFLWLFQITLLRFESFRINDRIDRRFFPPAKQAGDRVMTFANRQRLTLSLEPLEPSMACCWRRCFCHRRFPARSWRDLFSSSQLRQAWKRVDAGK